MGVLNRISDAEAQEIPKKKKRLSRDKTSLELDK